MHEPLRLGLVELPSGLMRQHMESLHSQDRGAPWRDRAAA
jgi:hypothetical protein